MKCTCSSASTATTRTTAIIVCPVSENALSAAGRTAVVAGLDWVLLNRSADYLDSLRQEFPRQVIFTVLPDQMEKGMEKDFWSIWDKWRKKKGVDLLKDSGRPTPHDEL